MYTILFGLYVYLQVRQQGRIHYHQVSLLLLYLLATGSLISSILVKNQYELYVLVIAFTVTESIDIISDTHIIDAPTAIVHGSIFRVLTNLGTALAVIYVIAK